MTKRATGSTAKASAPARAPSPASQRKSAAVEAYTKQTGSAPPKGWTTAKIEGRTRTLGYTGVSGTGYTTPRDGRAAAPKPAAPSPADAYRQRIGQAPPKNMSASAIDATLQQKSLTDRRLAFQRAETVRALDKISQVPSQPAAKSNVVVPKFFSTHSSRQSTRALINAPSEVYRAVSEAKWRDRDRNAAAKVLRDYRSDQLGRSMGPVSRAVMKAANSTQAQVATIAGAGVMAYLYGEEIAKGYMLDGIRGAVGTALSKASFGLTDKAYQAVTGKPDVGKAVDRAFGMRSPGLAGMDRRKATIEARPTRQAREAIDNTKGVQSPSIPNTRAESKNSLNSINAVVVGGALSIPAVAANTVILKHASGLAMKGLATVAPNAARVGARVLPGIGLGVMAVGAGIAAVGAMRRGDSTGQIMKSAAMGAVGMPTQGRMTADQSQKFAAANAKFEAPAPAPGTGMQTGWSNESRIAASIARGDQNIAYGGDPAAKGPRSGKN